VLPAVTVGGAGGSVAAASTEVTVGGTEVGVAAADPGVTVATSIDFTDWQPAGRIRAMRST